MDKIRTQNNDINKIDSVIKSYQVTEADKAALDDDLNPIGFGPEVMCQSDSQRVAVKCYTELQSQVEGRKHRQSVQVRVKNDRDRMAKLNRTNSDGHI